MTKFSEGRTRIAQFRLAAQEDAPYMAQYVHSLIPVERAGIGTMAIDKFGRLYYDPNYVGSITKECGSFSILHEALHMVFDHAAMAERIVGKAGSPTQYKVWNFAVDMVVNGVLREYIRHAPEGIITAERFGLPPKLTAIEYYHLLMDANEQAQQQQQENQDEQDEQAGDDSDGEDEGSGESEGEDGSQGSEGPSGEDATGDSETDDAGGSEGDDSEGGADGRMEQGGGELEGRDDGRVDEEGGGEGGDEVTDHQGGGGSCSDGKPRDYELPPDESWEDREFSMATDLENKCEAIGWGNVPGSIRKALGNKLRPQPDPFDVLRAACARAVSSPIGAPDYTYRRISRRQVEGQPRLKGVQKLTPNAVIVLDTSGSMLDAETEAKALTVVASGLRRLRSVRVIGGDMNITSNKQVSSLKQLEWLGGGGTSMKTVLEAVDREHRPDAIVLITDGDTDWPEKLRAKLVVALTRENYAPEWATAIVVGKKAEQ
jgi:predicted metal-dependent peptidase